MSAAVLAAPAPTTGGELLVARGIGKRFGPTVALADVSVTGRAGSIHAITGENGAGKSTLMKVLAGVVQPDGGEVLIAGRPARLHSPSASRRAGISTVFQELTVLPNLSVAENLLLGREPRRLGALDRRAMADAATRVLARIGVSLDPHRPCGGLSIGEQQLVEIAKGVSIDARIFIFDEPTAPLNRAEVAKLEALLATLKAQGKLVFYISHRLDEIFRFCDTVTVLKDGRRVASQPIESLDPERLVTLMVGRPLRALFPPRREGATGAAALDVRALAVTPAGASNQFAVHRGEIVGIGGLEGQGQREIVRALAGALRPHHSDIRRTAPDGTTAAFDPARGVVRCVNAGVGLIPEDRKTEGLYLDLTIADNIWLGALRGLPLMRRAPRERAVVERIAAATNLRARDTVQEVSSLSGGNQQKVMVGRWLAAGVDTLLVEEPTRGVDVGAKAEIYVLLRSFVAEGGAALVLSSDLVELIGLCDRILMVRAGRIVAECAAAQATEESLLALALSDADNGASPSKVAA